jgi:hypothetical protein
MPLLKVRSFDLSTRRLLQAVHDILPAVEEGEEGLPQEFVTEMTALQEKITGLPVEQKISVLDQARQAYDSDIFVVGVDFASQILQDGATTIYSADSPATVTTRAIRSTR